MGLFTKERWHPSEEVKELVCRGADIRGRNVKELYEKSKFYTASKLFGMGGITFSKKMIIFSNKVTSSNNAYWQAELIYHELVHVAQQVTLPQGWVGFIATYTWEWVRAGFKYQNMKKSGLEEEAYRLQKIFSQSI